jgi:hypothetical protein
MLSCSVCNGLLLVVESKCYDNFWIYTDKPNSELLAYVPEHSGLSYDGTTLSFSFCSSCGKVGGSAPIDIKVVNTALDVPQKKSVGDAIGNIYANSLLGNTRACIEDMKWVSIRISPVEFDSLTQAYNLYLDFRQNKQDYPEYTLLMNDLKEKYQSNYS